MEKQATWSVIAKEYVASLFPVFMLPDAYRTLPATRLLRRGVNVAVAIQHGDLTWYCQPKNWETGHRELAAHARRQPSFLRQAIRRNETQSKKLVTFSLRFRRADLSGLPSGRLNLLYQRYVERNTDVYRWSAFLPLLDFQERTFLADELSRLLGGRSTAHDLGVLTAPRRETFAKRQELDVLGILVRIVRHRAAYHCVRATPANQLPRILARRFPAIWRSIAAHVRRYAWVPYVYEGPAADPAYVVRLLKDSVMSGVDPVAQVRRLRSEQRSIAARQRALQRRLRLDRYAAAIVQLCRDAVFHKAYRRELQSWSYYNVEPLLCEIARRIGLSLAQVRMLLPAEVGRALVGGSLEASALTRRVEHVVYGWEGARRFCSTGSAAQRFMRQVKLEPVAKRSRHVTGTVACTGKAVGVVRVVNAPRDMVKMRPGDILVSRATSPNLMPAIRKASAIVTDEGGLTCHAAIVSRELGIPCVVGTKVATSVFRDGDRVEVDTERGVVRKI
ncbi:MAG: PEP-utilizing enzyme [bacterium]|nr:PEP-utilizing enzyme [bacterium]